RTAGDGELHFGRCPGAAKQPFELDAEAGRILRAETAPLLADASLHRTQALGVGMTRDEARGVEVRPDGGEILLSDAEEIDTLTAGDLDGRNLEFVGDVGDGAQLVRRRQPAPHAWDDRESSVLLDVGVNPLIDEARLGVVLVVEREGAKQIVVERRPAGRATA